MNKIQNLLNKTNSITNKYHQLLSNTGGYFNVFKIIGLTTEEVRLHSAFLAELLNPKGSHGLKEKPLDAFLKICLDNDFEFHSGQAECEVEYNIGYKTELEGGQVDIIVTDDLKRTIIIENKIKAKDQPHQMLRYYNYSKKYLDSRLVYLTLDGRSPSEYSIGDTSFNYKAISYKFDIVNWLTECKSLAIDFPLVREAISHYINLIKQLTNTSFMDEMKKEIVSLVMQSSENMQNAFEVDKVLLDIKVELQWKFWEQLKIALESKGVKVDNDIKEVGYLKVRGYYEKQRNRDIHYGLWSEIYNHGGITIHWGCEVDENIYFGFTIEKDGLGGISQKDEFEIYREIITQCDERYQSEVYWLGWQYTTPKLNFREFNSKEIFALTEQYNLERITNQIAEKAKSDIDFFLKRLKNSNLS